jgi:AP2-like factor (euAP2 lineage)
MKNKYQHNDDGTTHIFVESKGKKFPGKHTIIIDTEDWDKVKEHTWRISGSNYPYARTKIPHPDGGRWRYRKRQGRIVRERIRLDLMLHHLIMGKPKKGMVTDHIEHNGLDNRKENLRFVTPAQNMQNRGPNKNASSQYKGVGWFKRDKKWKVHIKHNGKQFHIGCFTCEKEAALAYNKKALELWGAEYALLNEVG